MWPSIMMNYPEKTFHLIMDNGYEYIADFLSGEIVMWAQKGEPFHWEKYKCLKSDDTTYFVVMELFDQPLRTCQTLVLDLENSLVTMHTAKQGEIPPPSENGAGGYCLRRYQAARTDATL